MRMFDPNQIYGNSLILETPVEDPEKVRKVLKENAEASVPKEYQDRIKYFDKIVPETDEMPEEHIFWWKYK